MLNSELNPTASLALDTLSLMAHDVEVAPSGGLYTWSEEFPKDHRGLVLTGNSVRARVGNMYPGMYGENGLSALLVKMAYLERSFIEAKLELSKAKSSVTVLMRACPHPAIPEALEAQVWPVVSSSWRVQLSSGISPEGPEEILDAALDLSRIIEVSHSRGAHSAIQLADMHGHTQSLGALDPMLAVRLIRKTVLQSEEVDWYNLSV